MYFGLARCGCWLGRQCGRRGRCEWNRCNIGLRRNAWRRRGLGGCFASRCTGNAGFVGAKASVGWIGRIRWVILSIRRSRLRRRLRRANRRVGRGFPTASRRGSECRWGVCLLISRYRGIEIRIQIGILIGFGIRCYDWWDGFVQFATGQSTSIELLGPAGHFFGQRAGFGIGFFAIFIGGTLVIDNQNDDQNNQ